MRSFSFSPALPRRPALTGGDLLIILVMAALLYAGVRLSVHAPEVIAGPNISLSYRALPWYALLSTGRMLVAYRLSLLFTLAYGYAAARNRSAERILMPLLDVLQSVPILSFLPVVLLSLAVILPVSFAAELAAIVLIFTSQAWNMTYRKCSPAACCASPSSAGFTRHCSRTTISAWPRSISWINSSRTSTTAPKDSCINWVAVGTAVARRPPHRPVIAALPHTVPTLDSWRRENREGSQPHTRQPTHP